MDDTPSKSDLARIDRMKDEDIDYSDIPPLDNSFFTKPAVQWPPAEQPPAPGRKSLVEVFERVRGLLTDEEIDRMFSRNRSPLDWSQCPAVESVPDRLGGAWVFKDTRMPVSSMFENLEAGATIAEIMEQFDITREQISAVLHFAALSSRNQ